MPKHPNITLKLIIRSGNKILLLRRKRKVYEFPGGRMNFLETIEDALTREIKEELGTKIQMKSRLFHIWNYVSKNKRRHSVMIYFICSIPRPIKYRSPERLEVLWVTKKDMKRVVSDPIFVQRMYEWKAGVEK